jgi:multicomponent K+:H+ antiporter subunit E
VTRWLPFPLVSALLLLMWLLLNQTLSIAHLVLGSILALVGSLAMAALDLPPRRLRRPAAIIWLALLVLVDIIRPNFAVARILLTLDQHARHSGFVSIPLDLRDSYALAVLACIITSTLGTIWVDFNSSNRVLLNHVLDLIDESAWVRTIKNRYERLLLEIFE